MLDVEQLATWAGWIMAILGLVLLIIRPVLNSFTKITKSLSEVTYTLQTINKDIRDSQSDRLQIHDELKDHDHRLDAQKEKLIEHTEQIKTLYKERG